MSLRKYVKQNARMALCGHWARAIGILMICVSICVIFSLLRGMTALLAGIPEFTDTFGTPEYFLDDVPALTTASVIMELCFLLATLVVNAPLMLGVRQWYYGLGGGSPEEVSSIFSFFSGVRLFLRAVCLHISLAVRSALWAAVFFAVPLGVCAAAWGLGARGSMEYAALLLLLGGMLLLLAGVFYLVHMKRYFLAPYLIAYDSGMTVHRAVRHSVREMRGGRTEVFLLGLTFVPWALLCVFLLPLLYVGPYYGAARALYARYFIERAQRSGRLTAPQPTAVPCHAEAPEAQTEDGTQA